MIEKKRILPLLVLFASLGCLVFLSLYLYLSIHSVKKSPPIYEEIYSTPAGLSSKIKDIDYAIYESLYREHIHEKDVFYLNLEPRHQNGHIWDYAELLIKCPDIESAIHLQKTINHDLTVLGPGLSIQNERVSTGGIICRIFLKGFYTHKIVLKFDKHDAVVDSARPRIAIIIDDLGYDSKTAFSFFGLGLPLSLSVLPYAPFTDKIVREAGKHGLEIILHLPMEPKNYPSVDPGAGALFLSMDEDKIRRILNEDLNEVPGAKGVNNHMGSSFTENSAKMSVVLEILKKKNLFYVDSRTTADTVGFELARKIGVPVAKRNVFLDNDLESKAIEMQMERLLSMARHYGAAIGIGHPHKQTLRVLEEYYSQIESEFQIVPVSNLVK